MATEIVVNRREGKPESGHGYYPKAEGKENHKVATDIVVQWQGRKSLFGHGYCREIEREEKMLS